MKSLTEFGGVQIRMAASAIAEARRSLPAEEPAQVAEPAAAEPPPAEAGGEAGAAPAAAEETAAAPEGGAKPAPEGESEAVKATLDAAVAGATGLSGDRLAMLRAAVEVVGKRAADVRGVRVFGAEEPVPGAKVIGERQYLVDFLPASMKQVVSSPKDERGGRRGGGKGGGGRGGASRGAGAGSTGGFSMDSLRDDRKNERGARRPGGGGRPGGAPRGAPKK
jgi:translation initiation factor IF-2